MRHQLLHVVALHRLRRPTDRGQLLVLLVPGQHLRADGQRHQAHEGAQRHAGADRCAADRDEAGVAGDLGGISGHPPETASHGGHEVRLPSDRWDLASRVLERGGMARHLQVRLLLRARTGVEVVTDDLNDGELDAALRGVTVPPGTGGCLCTGCGYFEAASVETLLSGHGFLPEQCPVCHGRGLPLADLPQRPL